MLLPLFSELPRRSVLGNFADWKRPSNIQVIVPPRRQQPNQSIVPPDICQPKSRLDDKISAGAGNLSVVLLFLVSVVLGIGVLFRALVFLFEAVAGTAVLGTIGLVFVCVFVWVLTTKSVREQKKEEALLDESRKSVSSSGKPSRSKNSGCRRKSVSSSGEKRRSK
jgi:hypothetical protein